MPHTYGFWEAGEFAPINNNESPKKGRKEGENAVSRKARGGVALKLTEKMICQLKSFFVNPNNSLAFPKIALFGISPRFAAMRGLPKKSECENCYNRKAPKNFRREKNAAEPTLCR